MRKMRKLESDQADMQKRLDKLKSDIEENKKAQEAQKAKLEAERIKLAEMRGRQAQGTSQQ